MLHVVVGGGDSFEEYLGFAEVVRLEYEMKRKTH